MARQRWEPLRELVAFRDVVDRLFEHGPARPGLLPAVLRHDGFPIDVLETEDAYEIRAELPGTRPDEAEITVQGGTVTIQATTAAEEERPGERWLSRERRVGTFRRSVSLPQAVDAERAEARADHGLLIVRLPKVEATPARRIPVGAGVRASAQEQQAAATVLQGSRDETAGGDQVTEESQESFPASDPPSWTREKV